MCVSKKANENKFSDNKPQQCHRFCWQRESAQKQNILIFLHFKEISTFQHTLMSFNFKLATVIDISYFFYLLLAVFFCIFPGSFNNLLPPIIILCRIKQLIAFAVN